MARQTNFKDYDPSRDYDQERDTGRDRSGNIYGSGGDIDPGFGEGRDYQGRDYVGSDFYSGDRELPDFAGTPREHDVRPPYSEPMRRNRGGRRAVSRGGERTGSRDYDDDYGRNYGYSRGYDRPQTRGRRGGRPSENDEDLRGIYAGREDYDSRYGHNYGGSGVGTHYGWGYDATRREGRGEGWLREGPHTGRGPVGYQRSNERILEDAHERLTRHGGLDAGRIEVRVDQGEITLEGSVDSRREKRMAEDALESISGIKDIHNRLRVENR